MMKTTLQLRHDIDIGNYHKLKSFLKNFSKGFQSKKSKVLTWKQITAFLDNADDYHYLVMKVLSSL